MLIVLVTLVTTSYCLIHFQKKRKFPTLQAVLLVSLAVVAVIQNIKFFYLIFFPSFEILPWIGKPQTFKPRFWISTDTIKSETLFRASRF